MFDPDFLLVSVAAVISFAAVAGISITSLQFMRPDMLPAIFIWIAFSLGMITGAGLLWWRPKRYDVAAVDFGNVDEVRRRVMVELSDIDDRTREILDGLDKVQIQIDRLRA